MATLGSPFLQYVEVPLKGSTTLWSINHASKFCIISKLSKGALPSPRSLMKTLNSTEPCIDPCRLCIPVVGIVYVWGHEFALHELVTLNVLCFSYFLLYSRSKAKIQTPCFLLLVYCIRGDWYCVNRSAQQSYQEYWGRNLIFFFLIFSFSLVWVLKHPFHS